MDDYIKIDYSSIPAQSKSIRNSAVDVNNKLLAIYRKISEMHICWYGKRYNELVTKFNELAPQLNQFLEVIVGEVPYMFEQIANTISDVDIKKNVAVPQKESIQKIQALQVYDDVGMRYISKEVEEINTDIMKIFQEIEDIMQEIYRTVDQIKLECDGSEEFRRQFVRLSEAFQYTIGNVETQFAKLMQQDKELMEKAEKNNNVANS